MSPQPCTHPPTRFDKVLPGSRLTVCDGTAWVTVDGRRADLIVAAGESLVLDGSAPVFVHPLRRDAPLQVRLDPPPAPPRRRASDRPWITRLATALRHPGPPAPHAA